MKVRKLPIVVEAAYFNERKMFEENPSWLKHAIIDGRLRTVGSHYFVKTLEGNMVGLPDSYLIRGINGELYPCDGDIFRKTYETVDNVGKE